MLLEKTKYVSRIQTSKVFEVDTFISFVKSGTSYPTTKRNITDDSCIFNNSAVRSQNPADPFLLRGLTTEAWNSFCPAALSSGWMLSRLKVNHELLTTAVMCEKKWGTPLFQLRGNTKRIHRHERQFWGLPTPFNGVAVKAHVIPLWVTRVDLSRSMTEGLGE